MMKNMITNFENKRLKENDDFNFMLRQISRMSKEPRVSALKNFLDIYKDEINKSDLKWITERAGVKLKDFEDYKNGLQ